MIAILDSDPSLDIPSFLHWEVISVDYARKSYEPSLFVYVAIIALFLLIFVECALSWEFRP